ncbi:MAG TPA: hypothetical protein VFY04_07065 [Solirubrobacterales bacterium]|nr:hypothetical protein [Solirubrobacterales bacterium]
MKTLRSHLSYANVASTLALLLALGMGSAYAANQLAPKSVGERQLRPGAVTADKLRKHAVTAPKLKAGAVKQGKIANGAVSGPKIANGAVSAEKLPNGVITSEKIADGSVTGAKVEEASLSRVPSAASADFATSAGSANPEAFARVSEEGAVFPGDSKGITSAQVTLGAPGVYCIAVPFAAKGGQVTPEFLAAGDVSAFLDLGANSCPVPRAEVRLYGGATLQKGPFYVVFYR